MKKKKTKYNNEEELNIQRNKNYKNIDNNQPSKINDESNINDEINPFINKVSNINSLNKIFHFL